MIHKHPSTIISLGIVMTVDPIRSVGLRRQTYADASHHNACRLLQPSIWRFGLLSCIPKYCEDDLPYEFFLTTALFVKKFLGLNGPQKAQQRTCTTIKTAHTFEFVGAVVVAAGCSVEVATAIAMIVAAAVSVVVAADGILSASASTLCRHLEIVTSILAETYIWQIKIYFVIFIYKGHLEIT